MTLADYPRMMFHRTKDPVIVQSEAEEAALGEEWSRLVNPPEWAEPPEPVNEPVIEPPEPPMEEAPVPKRAPGRRKKE